MKIPSLFRKKQTRRNSWQKKKWPSCNHPNTLSFRAGGDQEIFKTVNSVFFDPADGLETPESWFTNSSEESGSFSTEQSEAPELEVETVARGVRSERLFFEPGDTSSILEEAKPGGFPFKESVAMAMESEDPYVDFRRSMEEMVESHGVKDWECLEELLGWYLKVNGKKNHGFIVGAFLDILVGIAAAASSDSTSFSSAVSSFSSSSPLFSEINKEEKLVFS